MRNLEGNFVPAVPVKGTVLINIADLMQRWTSDRLKSTVCGYNIVSVRLNYVVFTFRGFKSKRQICSHVQLLFRNEGNNCHVKQTGIDFFTIIENLCS